MVYILESMKRKQFYMPGKIITRIIWNLGFGNRSLVISGWPRYYWEVPLSGL